LVATYRDQLANRGPLAYRDSADQTPSERYLNRAVLEDLRQGRPDVILALRPAPDRWEWGTRRLDFVKYFSRDEAFAREFSRYRYLGTVGEYQAFRRSEGAPAEAPWAPSEAALSPPSALGIGVQIAPPDTGALLQAAFFVLLFAIGLRRMTGSRE
ncbi:MAG TPA: hypothetical protein VEB59_05030, partial [Gemmatimonadales bacterium]|nr:hypothetical protein [Gemmatimonadales bacterium]